MQKIIRRTRRVLSVPVSFVAGYYGAFLSKLSRRLHERYVSRKLRGAYKGPLVRELMTIIEDLGRNHDQHAAMKAASDAIREALRGGEFERWINRSDMADEKATLIECADFLPGRSWKLQLFYIPEGHSHPPHSHSDVASCLVMAKGTIHAREYNRYHDLEEDAEHAMLSLTADRRLSSGDALLTTRCSNDVHWFGAVDGPAAAFNFQAVGFAHGRKLLEPRRVYVDPTEVRSAGIHKAPKLKRKDAELRFQHRPLSYFPLPS